MKKTLVLSFSLFCFQSLHAQVTGNYQYNNEQVFQNSNRNAVGAAYGVNTDEFEIKINGLSVPQSECNSGSAIQHKMFGCRVEFFPQ